MKNKSLKWVGAVCVGLAVLLVFGVWLHHRQSDNSTSRVSPVIDLNPKMSDEEFGAGQAQMGFMTQAESVQLAQTERAIKKRGTITASELDWTLQGLAQPPPSLPPNIPASMEPSIVGTRHLEFMRLLTASKSYTPAQKEQIYRATVGYLSSADTSDKLGALAVMRRLKDSRAIPEVKPLLNDRDKMVQTAAPKTLAVI